MHYKVEIDGKSITIPLNIAVAPVAPITPTVKSYVAPTTTKQTATQSRWHL